MGLVKCIMMKYNIPQVEEGEPMDVKGLASETILNSGSVTQSAEGRSFKPVVGGSTPSRPTINVLVAKKCEHCGTPMYIHRVDQQVVFAGCEPTIVGIKIDSSVADNVLITGKRSSKSIRCQNCRRRHLIRSFEDINEVTAPSTKGNLNGSV